jgi:hypothetical protein
MRRLQRDQYILGCGCSYHICDPDIPFVPCCMGDDQTYFCKIKVRQQRGVNDDFDK